MRYDWIEKLQGIQGQKNVIWKDLYPEVYISLKNEPEFLPYMNDLSAHAGFNALEALVLHESPLEIRLRSALQKLDAADYVRGNGLFRDYARAVMDVTLSLAKEYQIAKAENEKTKAENEGEKKPIHDLATYADKICSIAETFAQYIEREPAKIDGFFVATHLRGEILPRISNDRRIQESIVRVYSVSERPVFATMAAREYRLDGLDARLGENKKFDLVGQALDLYHSLKQQPPPGNS